MYLIMPYPAILMLMVKKLIILFIIAQSANQPVQGRGGFIIQIDPPEFLQLLKNLLQMLSE